MADGFTIDTTDLNRLAVDLGNAPVRATGQVEQILRRGATNLKGQVRRRFEESLSFGVVGRHVDYDRIGFAGSFGYEIGPTVGGAGSLAGIAVDGGANGGGGTVQIDDLLPAEAEAVERFIGQALENLL